MLQMTTSAHTPGRAKIVHAALRQEAEGEAAHCVGDAEQRDEGVIAVRAAAQRLHQLPCRGTQPGPADDSTL